MLSVRAVSCPVSTNKTLTTSITGRAETQFASRPGLNSFCNTIFATATFAPLLYIAACLKGREQVFAVAPRSDASEGLIVVVGPNKMSTIVFATFGDRSGELFVYVLRRSAALLGFGSRRL